MGAMRVGESAGAESARQQGLKWLVRRGLRRLYYRTPLRWRGLLLRLAFRVRPGWFRHHPSFQQQWVNMLDPAGTGLTVLSEAEDGPVQAPGRIALHCHLFYADLLDEFLGQMQAMPCPFDLYVSVPTDELAGRCSKDFGALAKVRQLKVSVVANRGRDIAPMLVEFGAALAGYDFIGHIQSKKSLYNGGATQGWREYLLQGLLGSPENVRRIFGLFQRDPGLGMIYPQTHVSVPYYAFSWLANRDQGARLCGRLGVAMPSDYFDFPAGSMFWARGESLRPLLELQLGLGDFPPEQGQTDGTTAHALERLLGWVPTARGYRTCIIADEVHPSWSPFRVDQQYLARSSATFDRIEQDASLRLVAFDIFDTLLVRPLLEADHTKQLIALRLGREDGALFSRCRGPAEEQARQRAGRDVGLTEIYRQFQRLSGCDEQRLARIRAEEEAVEIASVSPRVEVVALLRRAVAAGRRVILISDMFLERPVIETMLARHNIGGWQQLYLSCELGVRKDDGRLYDLMLAEEAVRGDQVLMVGDNERSDLQIPVDRFGGQVLHVLKARDLARCLPDYRGWIKSLQRLDGDVPGRALNRELTAGLLVRRHLNKIADFHAADADLLGGDAFGTGFNIVGPVVLSFCGWLLEQACQDGIEDLYFLAREGQLIKQVYDAWIAGRPEAPRSHYLQVSRRAVNVPTLETFEDALAIAREVFHAGPASSFLYERYGLRLSSERWDDIHRRGIWRPGRPLEVQARDVRRIEPLLRELFPDMQVEAAQEKAALLSYLEQQGLVSAQHAAVVDVGYSGTIQKALNRLGSGPVDGYYMATSDAIGKGLPASVRARGCFVDEGEPVSAGSRMLSDSFELEKLLSSDDAQVRKYLFAEDGRLEREFKSLSAEERQSRAIRTELQRGCMAFVAEAVALRQQLHPGFAVAPEVADTLYTRLIIAHLGQQGGVTTRIILDDDYCGRGLIS